MSDNILNEIQTRKDRSCIYYGQTYMKYIAMQMLGRNNVYAEIFRDLEIGKDNKRPFKVFEIGFGTADSTSFVIKSLKNQGASVSYFGLDNNPRYVVDAEKRIDKAGCKLKSLKCVEALDLQESQLREESGLGDQNADLVLAEHVFYYASSTQEELEYALLNTSKLLSPDRLFIAVVSGPSSDIGKLRLLNEESKLYEHIEHGLANIGLQPNRIDVPALFPFPKLTDSEWNNLANGVYEFDNPLSGNDRVTDALRLVNFFGRPTEIMHQEGILKPYVEKIRDILSNTEKHALSCEASIIVSASQGSSQEFINKLAQSVARIKNGIGNYAEKSIEAAMQRFEKERVDINSTRLI